MSQKRFLRSCGSFLTLKMLPLVSGVDQKMLTLHENLGNLEFLLARGYSFLEFSIEVGQFLF